jgi:hypothetical protein
VQLAAEEHTEILNVVNEVLSGPITRAVYNRTRLQHTKMQPAQTSKSTPSQPAWPRASSYTPRPKPPYNSCSDSAYIPQVVPHPSDFDFMSEQFARSPPWAPKRTEQLNLPEPTKRPEPQKHSEPPKRPEPPKHPEAPKSPAKRNFEGVKSEHHDLLKREHDLLKHSPSSPDNVSSDVPNTPETPRSPSKQETTHPSRGRVVLLKRMRFPSYPVATIPSPARSPGKDTRQAQGEDVSTESFAEMFGLGAYAAKYKEQHQATFLDRYCDAPRSWPTVK